MILIYLCHTLCHALFSTIKQTRSAQWNTADFLPFFLAHFQSLFLLFFGLSLLPQLATHENLCCLCVFFHPGQPLALAQVLQRQCAQCQAHTAAGTARFYLSPLSLCVAHHLIYWSRCLSPLLPFYLPTYLPHSQQWLTHNLISQPECLCFDNTAEVYRFTPCTANTHIHQFISLSLSSLCLSHLIALLIVWFSASQDWLATTNWIVIKRERERKWQIAECEGEDDEPDSRSEKNFSVGCCCCWIPKFGWLALHSLPRSSSHHTQHLFNLSQLLPFHQLHQ